MSAGIHSFIAVGCVEQPIFAGAAWCVGLHQLFAGEVPALIADNTLEKIEKEIKALRRQRQEGILVDAEDTLDEIDRDISKKKGKMKRRKRHEEEVRGQLTRERERVINRLLPRRASIDGDAPVFPLSTSGQIFRQNGTRASRRLIPHNLEASRPLASWHEPKFYKLKRRKHPPLRGWLPRHDFRRQTCLTCLLGTRLDHLGAGNFLSR